jgi:hypothetical protein
VLKLIRVAGLKLATEKCDSPPGGAPSVLAMTLK